MKKIIVFPLALVAAMALSGCLEEKPVAGESEAASASETETQQEPQARQSTPDPKPAPKTQVKTERKTEPVTQAPPPPVCGNCGTVSDIQQQKVKGKGSGAGAVAGAIAGVIVGNQFSNEKDAARVIGGVGGAVAGHEIEKRVRGETYFAVTVRMDSGGTQTVNLASADQLQVGQKVRVEGNNVVLR